MMILPLAQTSPPAVPDDIDGIIVLAPDPGPWPWILGSFAVLAVLAALGLLAWWLIRKSNRDARRLSPEATALRSFQRIEEETPSGDPAELGLRMSETLKNFLRDRYADPLRYETAEEFLARLAGDQGRSRLPPALHQDLRSFVVMSEELKFGRPGDARKRIGPLLQLAYNIVNLSQTVSESPPVASS